MSMQLRTKAIRLLAEFGRRTNQKAVSIKEEVQTAAFLHDLVFAAIVEVSELKESRPPVKKAPESPPVPQIILPTSGISLNLKPAQQGLLDASEPGVVDSFGGPQAFNKG